MTQTVAACQLAVTDAAVEANLASIRERIRALPERVELAVFPELALTGAVPDGELPTVACERDGPAIETLRSLAETEQVGLVVGFHEDAGDAYYNALAYCGPDGEFTVYRKRHLWDQESDRLATGDELVTVETPLGTAGLLTCYDLNFVADSAAFAREEITHLLVAGAWPAAYSENWRLLLRARALDGVRWAVGANRTGESETEDEVSIYAGRSLVARPDGGIHGELDRQERTIVADLDPAVLDFQREFISIYDHE